MLRIISRMDVKGENVVKGIHLEGLRVVGKPDVLAKKYYDQGVDEIIFMDIVASLYGRNNILDTVTQAAEQVFVPLTVGGGIRTIDDIVSALRHGADKVAINTAAINRPDFIREAAQAVGSQAIVLSVEAKRQAPGKWEALTDNGREKTGIDVLDWVEQGEALGAGEILITSVDQEGTRKGFDTELTEKVLARVKIPVIACGGAGSAEDVDSLVSQTNSDSIACASIFHYDICPIPVLKESLEKSGNCVRR